MKHAFRLGLGLVLLAACGPATGPSDGGDAGGADEGTVDTGNGSDTPQVSDVTTIDGAVDVAVDVQAEPDAAVVDDVGTTPDAAPPVDGAACATTPTFATVQSQVFVGCGGKGFCHTRGTGSDNLLLNDVTTQAQLVNVPSVSAPGLVRVVPGDVANSFLWRKLTNDLAADGTQGAPMPVSMLAGGWHMLPANEMDLVRCWIAGGAP